MSPVAADVASGSRVAGRGGPAATALPQTASAAERGNAASGRSAPTPESSVAADERRLTVARAATVRSRSGHPRHTRPMATAPKTRTTARLLLNKVPEITVYFWVIKVLCTTV